MSSSLPPSVTQAREAAQQAASTAGNYNAAEQSVVDVLRGKIQEAYSSNQDLISKLDQSIAGYTSAPAVAREKFQNIFNPFQRESLVSQYVANQGIPMMTNAGLLGQRLGRIEDLVGAGARAFGTQATAAQNQAQIMQQNYQNLLNEYQITHPAGGRQVVEANGRKLLIDTDTGAIISDLGAAPAGGGGGTVINLSGIPGLNTNTTSNLVLFNKDGNGVQADDQNEYDKLRAQGYMTAPEYANYRATHNNNTQPTQNQPQAPVSGVSSLLDKYKNPFWQTPWAQNQPLF